MKSMAYIFVNKYGKESILSIIAGFLPAVTVMQHLRLCRYHVCRREV